MSKPKLIKTVTCKTSVPKILTNEEELIMNPDLAFKAFNPAKTILHGYDPVDYLTQSIMIRACPDSITSSFVQGMDYTLVNIILKHYRTAFVSLAIANCMKENNQMALGLPLLEKCITDIVDEMQKEADENEMLYKLSFDIKTSESIAALSDSKAILFGDGGARISKHLVETCITVYDAVDLLYETIYEEAESSDHIIAKKTMEAIRMDGEYLNKINNLTSKAIELKDKVGADKVNELLIKNAEEFAFMLTEDNRLGMACESDNVDSPEALYTILLLNKEPTGFSFIQQAIKAQKVKHTPQNLKQAITTLKEAKIVLIDPSNPAHFILSKYGKTLAEGFEKCIDKSYTLLCEQLGIHNVSTKPLSDKDQKQRNALECFHKFPGITRYALQKDKNRMLQNAGLNYVDNFLEKGWLKEVQEETSTNKKPKHAFYLTEKGIERSKNLGIEITDEEIKVHLEAKDTIPTPAPAETPAPAVKEQPAEAKPVEEPKPIEEPKEVKPMTIGITSAMSMEQYAKLFTILPDFAKSISTVAEYSADDIKRYSEECTYTTKKEITDFAENCGSENLKNKLNIIANKYDEKVAEIMKALEDLKTLSTQINNLKIVATDVDLI